MPKKNKLQILSIIVCMSQNRCIGKNGIMPWHIPEELALFKKITLNHTVIMGRKTYESIGKPLKNRTNIILTKNKSFQADNCLVYNNLLELQTYFSDFKEKEIFIIGGQEIYQLFLPLINKIYLSTLHRNVEGNKFFPLLSKNEFKMTHEEEMNANENFTFQILERI